MRLSAAAWPTSLSQPVFLSISFFVCSVNTHIAPREGTQVPSPLLRRRIRREGVGGWRNGRRFTMEATVRVDRSEFFEQLNFRATSMHSDAAVPQSEWWYSVGGAVTNQVWFPFNTHGVTPCRLALGRRRYSASTHGECHDIHSLPQETLCFGGFFEFEAVRTHSTKTRTSEKFRFGTQ